MIKAIIGASVGAIFGLAVWLGGSTTPDHASAGSCASVRQTVQQFADRWANGQIPNGLSVYRELPTPATSAAPARPGRLTFDGDATIGDFEGSASYVVRNGEPVAYDIQVSCR